MNPNSENQFIAPASVLETSASGNISRCSAGTISKICSKCGELQGDKEFVYNKLHCRKCRNEYLRLYRRTYKLSRHAQKLKSARDKRHYCKYKEQIKNKSFIYYYKNAAKIALKAAIYNKKPTTKSKRRILANFHRGNPKFTIRSRLQTRISKLLRGFSKSTNTGELIGCSYDALKIFLENKFESGMFWENYGRWQIDHVIPCELFDFSISQHQKWCFNYTNLQPMWGKDNIRKGDLLPDGRSARRLSKQEKTDYLIKLGFVIDDILS